MSLNEISNDILTSAKSQKETIETQTKAKIEELETEQTEKFNAHKEKTLQKHNSEISLVNTKLSSLHKKQVKEIEQTARSDILNQVKTNALDKILTLDKKDKEQIYKKLLKIGKEMIKFDTIICGKSDKTIVSELSKTSTIKTQDNLVGLIFETKDGSERLDLNFVHLFNDLYSEKENEVQNILFN